jgi:hypothetical protein
VSQPQGPETCLAAFILGGIFFAAQYSAARQFRPSIFFLYFIYPVGK